MLLNRISMRVNVVLTLAAMGLLSLGIAVIAGRIYRDHALENERAAVSERLRISSESVRRQITRDADILAAAMTSAFTATNIAPRSPQLAASLDRMLVQHGVAERAAAGTGLALYDGNIKLVVARSESGAEASQAQWAIGCDQLKALVHRSDAKSASPASGYCFAGQRLYYTTFRRIPNAAGSIVQVALDVVPYISASEATIGSPLRLALADNSTVHQSPNWPGDELIGNTLIASMPLDVPSMPAVSLQLAKDERNFYARLERISQAVVFATAAITLFVILIAAALLERTVVSPLRNLVGQVRNLLQDESQLGNRISATGNAEAKQLAEGFNEMTGRLESLYDRLERMAFTDALTRLPNRTFFYDCLEKAIADAQRENRAFALFIMDLNRFKEINDVLGHHIGDLLLQQVAVRLRDKLRDSDTIARMGGDEFAVLLPNVTWKQADTAARMLLQSLRSPFVIESHQLDIGTSIGAALYPDHGVDLHTLIQRADVAMYAAKQAGCGHMFYDPEMDRHRQAQLTLMGELRQAVEQEQFVLYYQPKIGLKTNRVVGVEALVRWRHPSGSLIMPETFIPLLEQTGLIRGLTSWVTHEALRMGGELRRRGFDLPIAVNISARDLQNANLAEELAEHLAVHQAAAQWLELEITESAVMSDIAGAQELLNRLAGMGFKLVIDDFGTGYSSLAYLKRLPVQAVKIDKSFVMGMARDENDAAIVYTSIDLTHNLGLQVVAEGVDDEGVLIRLRARGCDSVQGMFLSRPLSGEELTDWLTKSIWGMPARVAC